MKTRTRTTYCGLVGEELINKEVILHGWVQNKRNFGNLIFVDLRDREGIVQLVFNQDTDAAIFQLASELKSEYVVEIQGTVMARDTATVNPDMKTGKIEVIVNDLVVLNKSEALPFEISDNNTASEDVKLKYRYLDLRRPEMQKAIRTRSAITRAVHSYYDNHGYLDIETPDLTSSTPEGARDYLVPSRVYPGSFYALPQSPQLFKQLLMAAGFDKYYQIARCFRDEDLRGDRQPEFTQIDIETTFLSDVEIQTETEGLFKQVMKDVKGIDVQTPFPRLKWQDAMDKYGSDKPDLRFGMEIQDISEVVKDSEFKPFAEAAGEGQFVRAIVVNHAAAKYSRKDLDAQQKYIERYGAKSLLWAKYNDDELKGAAAKGLADVKEALVERLNLTDDDLILIVAGKFQVVCDSLGYLRKQFAKEMDMIDKNRYAYAWIVDWPLFEYDEGFGKWIAAHHPFTRPRDEDIPLLDTDPHKAHAISYDIILNGYELGGGSLRIFDPDVQRKMLSVLGVSPEKAQERFGHLLNAMKFGFPPSGGIAIGLDRFAMLLAGRDNIRDVIAFPKNSRATEPMTNAPSEVTKEQLDELGIEVIPQNKN
ncbi:MULTISPECIES: aspartate--tRNA ligase [Latilactobacillus]|uniref:Aspartate--tRNA ligase n=1 Tax=Latilactobacillus curvatus TaxID=28038 RepID=A0ABM7QTJ5_LATCU|nr:aspartate--tRNA ligase [Latilactobacillus curvatus]BCX30386.1 aspartate--tRNA ligase [Latilactobacillus curvatus]